MTLLIDTNVISAVRRQAPPVTAWYASVTPDDVHFSVISFGEIRKGIEMKRPSEPVFAERLERWLLSLRDDYRGSTLPVTDEIALLWGKLSAGRSRGPADSLIAATAIVHDLTLVTRNTRDFEDLPLKLFNPWAA